MKIKAIIALGNPGPDYKNSYHNVGVFVTEFLEQYSKEANQSLDFFYSTQFMNKSGDAVAEFLKNKNFDLSQCLIVHDDSDLSQGDYKLSFNSSSAGHKGVQDIIQRFKTQEFWRLRIGIRPKEEEIRKPASDFVLKSYGKSQALIFEQCSKEAWAEILEKLS